MFQDIGQSKERSVADIQIESCKLALRKLNPELKSVSLTKENREGMTIQNKSFFDVQIDVGAIKAILLACDFPESDFHEIEIIFRSATLADGNFHGQIVGGQHVMEGLLNEIEIYTSIPDVSINSGLSLENKMKKTQITHYGFNKRTIALAILEELRHSIQEKTHLFDFDHQRSFDVSSVDDLREIDYEQDAEVFSTALLDDFEKFIEVKRYEVDGLAEMYVDVVQSTNPNPFFDSNLVARVTETDPQGLYLIEELESLNIIENEKLDVYLNKIVSLLKNRKIGFVEARWIFQQVRQKLNGVGDLMKMAEVESMINQIS